jgi:phosphatidate phosphatase APP1
MITLEELLTLFPEKKFILMGDNTQHDVSIYLSAAEKFSKSIQYIIIRKVREKKSEQTLIANARDLLRRNGIGFYYADEFPKEVE